MARNQTFDRLIQMVRAEAGHFGSANAGINADGKIRATIARTYEALAREHNWPHLVEHFPVTLAAGQSLYAIPAGADPDRLMPDECFVHYSVEAHRYPIECAEITWQHKNEMDPAVPAGRMDPARLWQPVPDDRIEVWPCPATDGNGTLYIRAHRLVTPLVAGTDLCRLDDRLVSLFAAAELIGPEKGRALLSQGQSMLQNLKGSSATTSRRTVNMARRRGDECAAARPRIEVVYTRAV